MRLSQRPEQEGHEAADAIRQPAPELTTDEGARQQHRQHERAGRRLDAEISAQRDDVRARHGHRHATQEGRNREQGKRAIGRQVEHPVGPTGRARGALDVGGRRCGSQDQDGDRHDQERSQYAVAHHGLLPAVGGDRALEQEWPRGAGHVLAAGDQGQRGAAAALEPARDIDVERGVDGAVAEQPDEKPVPNVELPGRSSRCEGETGAYHEGAADHRQPDADAIGEPPHG